MIRPLSGDPSPAATPSPAEAQLLAISGAITDAIVCADDAGGIVFWSPAAERMFGWAAAEARGRPLTTIMPERFRAAHDAGLRRVVAGGEPRLIGRSTVELFALHRDGHELPVELSLGRFVDEGRPLFVGVVRDVSERRRQQRHREARVAVAGALTEAGDEDDTARRILQALGTTMGWSLGAVWLDAGGTDELRCVTTWAADGVDDTTFDATSRALRLAYGEGLPGHAAASRAPLWMDDAVHDSRHRRRDAVRTTGLRCAVALPMVTDEGVVGVVEFYGREIATPDLEDAGAMEALCTQLGLVFLRKRAERAAAESAAETRARAAELERSNRDLDQFASIASHDLSEPLRTVAGFLDLLRRRHAEELPAEARELVERAIAGATRMRSLIDDLLVYSRASSVEFEHVPVDLAGVAAAVAEALGGVARAEQGAVLVAGALPTVLGDPGRLEQVLQNLVANGLKFHGDDPPAVTISATPDGAAWWRVTVEDNGIGIAEADAERAFEMFGRLHHRDQYPGTGIGLAVCKRIVQRHGGRIWHEARPGGGSRFHFTLPTTPI